MTPEQYLALMTMHGTIMIFMVLTTAPQSGFGNYFLPIQIGAADMAFPVLNMLSFWTTFVSLMVMVSAFFVAGGAPIGGWTSYPPLSALGEIAGPGQGAGETLWIIGLAIFCGASLMGALNFITTLIDLRAKGMTSRAASAHVLDLACDRDPWPAGFRRSSRRVHFVACSTALPAPASSFPAAWWSPIKWSPGTRAARRSCGSTCSGSSAIRRCTSQFFPAWAWRRICSPRFRASRYSATARWSEPICGIGFLGFCVWGHHMFVSGMSPYSAFAFSILTMTIGVPSAIKTFNWLGTLWGGKIQFNCAMLFALGFVSLFVSGGLSGLVSGAAVVGSLPARYVLRRRALPFDHGRRRDFRDVRRDCISGSQKCLAGS